MSFTGEYRHTLDAKGRLTVPSRMRDALGNGEVVLTKWLDGCIGVWTPESFAEMQATLRAQGQGSKAAREIHRWFNASAHQDAVDKQGRITVPPNLREYAAIDRDAVVIGDDTHAEIWSADRWNEEQSQVDDARVAELAEQLSF